VKRIAGLGLGVLLLAACGTSKRSSPEATFLSYREALAADDAHAVFEHFDPRRLPAMAMGSISAMTAMSRSDPALQSALEEILRRHGVSLPSDPLYFTPPNREAFENRARELLQGAADLPGLCAELSEAIEKHAGVSAQTANFKGDLRDLAIDGSRARANVILPDGKTHALEFVELDGEWFIAPGW
jgi:hypothetical protein